MAANQKAKKKNVSACRQRQYQYYPSNCLHPYWSTADQF